MRRSGIAEAARRGFTLVELLVIVCVLGIVAAVGIPALLRAAHRRAGPSAPGAAAGAAIVQAPLEARSVLPDGDGAAPLLLASTVRARLERSEALDGLRAVTVFTARFEGVFRLRNQDPRADRLELWFPYPPGVDQATEVALEARRPGAADPAEAAFREPADGVRFARDGLGWRAAVRPGEEVEVRVGYVAAGRDAFRYAVAGAGRVGRLSFVIDLPAGGAFVTPPSALAPTSVERGPGAAVRLAWEHTNLVTARPIVVELPAGESPLGRLILLARLFGLSLLIFGAGFWYLAEGYQPGSLRAFRWPHLALLGAAYFAFFPIHALIGLHAGPITAVACGLAVALPLLAAHTGRFVDGRFAVMRAAPFALATLGLVVAAALAPAARLPLGVGTLVAGVAVVTLTFPRWAEGRRAAALAREREAERARALDRARADQDGIAKEHALLAEAAAEVEEARARLGADLPRDLAEVLARLAAQQRAAEEGARRLAARSDLLREVGDPAKLADESARLAEVAERERARVVEARRLAERALADVAQALDRAAVASGASASSAGAGARASASALAGASTTVSEGADAHVGALACAPALAAPRRCPGCAAAADAADRFCRACGAGLPIVIACAACGETWTMPAQLLRRRWQERVPPHCGGCGAPRART